MTSPLVHDDNREPLRVTARRIGRSVETAKRLCREGKLAHQRDACGWYWSSADAAAAFMGPVIGGDQVRRDTARRAEEVFGVRPGGNAPMGRRGNGAQVSY